MLLQAADLVFVGKSLPPYKEGQTPIEAAGLNLPLMFGPGMSNFKEVSDSLLKCGAAAQVNGEEAVTKTAIELLRNSSERDRMSAAAVRWHAANRGATTRTLCYLRGMLKREGTPGGIINGCEVASDRDESLRIPPDSAR